MNLSTLSSRSQGTSINDAIYKIVFVQNRISVFYVTTKYPIKRLRAAPSAHFIKNRQDRGS